MNWLSFAANAIGLAGSLCLVIPFFRENGLRSLRSTLHGTTAGGGGADEAFGQAGGHADEKLAQWSPVNYWLMVIGIALVGLSYFVGGADAIFGTH
jgi:hypothetical protein